MIGWDFIKAAQDSGRPVDSDDLPPALDWEAPVWALFERVRDQWRHGFNGRTGMDYSLALGLMRSRGWDIDLGHRLLSSIVGEYLHQDALARERENGGR